RLPRPEGGRDRPHATGHRPRRHQAGAARGHPVRRGAGRRPVLQHGGAGPDGAGPRGGLQVTVSVPSITGTQRPPTRTRVTAPAFFSALVISRLGRPISTPWSTSAATTPSALASRLASSAPLALPVAGPSIVPPSG